MIIVHLKGGSCSSVVKVLPCSGCFITCMGVHFPAVELDNTIWFSILLRMSGFLWHSSKWACQVGRFLQYMSGTEVERCICHIYPVVNSMLMFMTNSLPQNRSNIPEKFLVSSSFTYSGTLC